MAKQERRRRTRVQVQQRIRHSKYQVLGTPVFEENSAVDLSSGGVSFETRQEYPKGALVLLEIELSPEPLKVLVCVAWIRPTSGGKHLVGAELIAIDPEHKKAMQSHLSKLLKMNLKPNKKPKASKSKKRKTARPRR